MPCGKLWFTLKKLQLPQVAPPNISLVAEYIVRKQEQMEEYTDNRRRSKHANMKHGDWVRTIRPTRKHKLASFLSNPLIAIAGPKTFVLEDGSRWKARSYVASREPGYRQPHTFMTQTLDMHACFLFVPTFKHLLHLRRFP